MHIRHPSQKVLAALVVAFLSLLTTLGTVSGPPEVPISDLGGLEGGAVVKVRGTVVEIWDSDSGSLSLVLADLMSLSTVKVVCSIGRLGASLELHPGDEATAAGQLEVTGGRPLLWASGDDVRLIALSRDAFDLEDLSRSWKLLVDDRFEIVGVLLACDEGASFRLADPAGSVSIALLTRLTDCSRYLDRRILVDGVLRLEPETMELALYAFEISLSSQQ